MKIPFYVRNLYGRDVVYIADEQTASLVSSLTGTKTVSNSQLSALSKLGHAVEQVPDPRFTSAPAFAYDKQAV